MCTCLYMDPGGEGEGEREGLTERESERERERDAILCVCGRRADVSEGAGCRQSGWGGAGGDGYARGGDDNTYHYRQQHQGGACHACFMESMWGWRATLLCVLCVMCCACVALLSPVASGLCFLNGRNPL
jgi:hypothetical protein